MEGDDHFPGRSSEGLGGVSGVAAERGPREGTPLLGLVPPAPSGGSGADWPS